MRQQGRGRRRDQILLAAHALIVEQGLAGVTMRALAAAAGLSVPTIYNLVGGRDEVIRALLAVGASRFDAAMLDAPTEPIDRAVTAVATLAELVVENRAVVHAVAAAGGVGGASRDALLLALRSEMERTFRRARARGLIRRSSDPATLASRVQALAAGAVIDWALGHGRDERLRWDLEHGVALVLVANAVPSRRVPADALLRRAERGLSSIRAVAPPPSRRIGATA